MLSKFNPYLNGIVLLLLCPVAITGCGDALTPAIYIRHDSH